MGRERKGEEIRDPRKLMYSINTPDLPQLSNIVSVIDEVNLKPSGHM